MSNELPWQVWTPDDLAPPPETFVPVEADNVTLTDDTPEPELTAEQQLEQELAQLKIQAHEQGYNAGLAEGRQKGHAQGYQEGLAQGLEQGQAQAQTQQAPIHARMQQLVSEFQNTLDALDSVIASRLMQMALEAARQVIGQTSGACASGPSLLSRARNLSDPGSFVPPSDHKKPHQCCKFLPAAPSPRVWSLPGSTYQRKARNYC